MKTKVNINLAIWRIVSILITATCASVWVIGPKLWVSISLTVITVLVLIAAWIVLPSEYYDIGVD